MVSLIKACQHSSTGYHDYSTSFQHSRTGYLVTMVSLIKPFQHPRTEPFLNMHSSLYFCSCVLQKRHQHRTKYRPNYGRIPQISSCHAHFTEDASFETCLNFGKLHIPECTSCQKRGLTTLSYKFYMFRNILFEGKFYFFCTRM